MFKLSSILAVVFVSLMFVGPSFGDNHAAADEAVMASIGVKLDAREISPAMALVEAVEQKLSFAVIVAFCRDRGLPLANVVTAALPVGMSEEVALAKLVDAGISSGELARLRTAGLGYTPADPDMHSPSVRTMTAHPGGRIHGRSVSPSTL